MNSPTRLQKFRRAYGLHREREGRKLDPEQMKALPFVCNGTLARQWEVKARTYNNFIHKTIRSVLKRRRPPLSILDIGAGNGWLSNRLVARGHRAFPFDLRTDDVDGLGAGSIFAGDAFHRIAGTFDALPISARAVDVTVFNASIHYATDLRCVLAEALRVTRIGGAIAILDSPFYPDRAPGEQMAAAKRESATDYFGDLAEDLMAIPSIEFLTREMLRDASEDLGLAWKRHRVWYPLWYEMRPVVATLKRRRSPSRFDLWEAMVT